MTNNIKGTAESLGNAAKASMTDKFVESVHIDWLRTIINLVVGNKGNRPSWIGCAIIAYLRFITFLFLTNRN